MKESTLETYLTNQVKKYDGLSLKFTSPNVKGVPDRIVIHDGHVYFVELKAPNGRLSKMQQYMHKQFAKVGIEVFVLYDKPSVDEFIRENVASLTRNA